MNVTRQRWAVIQAALLLAAACSGPNPAAPTRPAPTTPIAVEPPLLVKTVSGAVGPLDLVVGQSEQLAAFLFHGDGTQEPVASVTWRAAMPAVATVTAEGRVTGQTIGETRVWAEAADGRTAYMSVNVMGVIRPVDPRFDDQYWRELVFNGYEEPDAVAYAVTWVLETPSPDFYIRLDNPGRPDWPSDNLVALMRDAIPRLAEQLTGQPYRGRIETGDTDREQQGWISVVFETQTAACGRARIGADPGRIWMSPTCFSLSDEGLFLSVFAHEVGHAFGLRHVSDNRAAMWKNRTFAPRFNAQEEYHARLAYKVGRWQRYPGWRSSRTLGPTNLGTERPTIPLPVIVVDD